MRVTETWQKPNDYFYLNQTVPSGYEYISKPRYSGKGGGLALIYRDRHKVYPISLSEPSTFEILAVQLKGPTPTVLVMIYRPPVFSELSTILTYLCTLSPNIILMGDFNIHFDNIASTQNNDFKLILDSADLQHIIRDIF